MKTENRQTGQRAQLKKKHLVAAQGGSGNSARCMQCYRERNYICLPDVASKYIMQIGANKVKKLPPKRSLQERENVRSHSAT